MDVAAFEGEKRRCLERAAWVSRRGDGRSGDRKWSHIGKVSTSQDSIFRGEQCSTGF